MPVPLSDSQNAPPFGLSEMPQGLIRFGSRISATPRWSETRFRCWSRPVVDSRQRSSSASSATRDRTALRGVLARSEFMGLRRRNMFSPYAEDSRDGEGPLRVAFGRSQEPKVYGRVEARDGARPRQATAGDFCIRAGSARDSD